jgi:hypothetical protein
MDQFKELPREAQVTIVCLVLFVIISFFDWQQVTVGPYSAGKTLWHGIGIITVLIAIAYLIWEIARALKYEVKVAQVTPPTTSAGFAIALLVFTVITFFDWSDFRHWPEWVGLLLSIIIAVVAFKRAKDEGVEMPKMPESVTVNRGGDAAASAPPPSEPAPPADPAPPASEGGSEEAPPA